MRRTGPRTLAVGQAALRWLRPAALCVVSAVAMTAAAHAQSTSRPQLVVQRAEADLAAEMLLIEGQNLLWNNDSDVTVTLAGTPLAVLTATDAQVLAQLPPGLAPGTYLLKVSRGPGAVQNGAFDLTVGAIGLTGPPGPQGAEGQRGEPGPQGPTGAAGTNGLNGGPGPNGPTGPSGPEGPKGLNARGAWSDAAGYVLDDVVTDGGQTWRCLAANCTVGVAPTLEVQGPEWQLLAARGADGAPGEPGAQGPAGPTGPAGTNGLNGGPGPAGPTGQAGPTGPAGPTGAAGTATRAAPPCFDNTNRYVNCGNGTVTDTVTGLIWLKDANCFGAKTYSAANQAAAGLADRQCALTDGSSVGDWRLPTKAEWEATVAQAVALGCEAGLPGDRPSLNGDRPSLNNDAGTGCLKAGPTSFTGVQLVQAGFYWSSSAREVDPVVAWSVRLSSGDVLGVLKDDGFLFVWPVRGGR